MTTEMNDLLKLAVTALDPETDRDTAKRSMTRVLHCLDTYRGVFGAEFMARLYKVLMNGSKYDSDGMVLFSRFTRRLLRRRK